MAFSLVKLIFLVSLSSCIFASMAQNNAGAGDLVQKICTKARNPNFCNDFFKADHGVSSLQILGQKAFDNAKASVTKANNIIASLVKTTTDPSLKEKYNSCLENYGDAISSLDEARNSFNDPKTMNIKVTAVMTNVDTCNDGIAGKPVNLKTENEHVDNICSIILVISNLL